MSLDLSQSLKTQEELTINFAKNLPYKSPPFNSRAWGHKFHSLCSYQGKLKPAISHFLVQYLSQPGDMVLDPLGGVGTVAFEACLQGRLGISNDISPLAYAISKAKLSRLNPERIFKRLEDHNIEILKYSPSNFDIQSTDFGLNGKVKDYFHPKTMKEILYFRECFLNQELSQEDLWIRANLLHILHGNRPYALSRMSHGITPMNPKGPFIYKNVIDFIANRVKQLARHDYPMIFQEGVSHRGSFEELREIYSDRVDLIVTSPPFLGMRFDRPNWLRLWFLGWGKSDFHTRSLLFLDRQQTKTFKCYEAFFETCADILKQDKLLVMHLGGSSQVSMADKILEYLPSSFRLVHRFDESVEGLENFGISQRGKTKTHEFIVVNKR